MPNLTIRSEDELMIAHSFGITLGLLEELGKHQPDRAKVVAQHYIDFLMTFIATGKGEAVPETGKGEH